MTRETLIAEMVLDARSEDANWPEGNGFEPDSFGDFFPEYASQADKHGVEWDASIWDEAYLAYLRSRKAAQSADTAEDMMKAHFADLRPLGRAV